jgi:hypothetical protein
MREVLPEISGIPYCVRARVVKIRDASTVDVRVLARDGSLDSSVPVLPELKLPAGSGPVTAGAEVRVGFYYNAPDQPYIDAVLGG